MSSSSSTTTTTTPRSARPVRSIGDSADEKSKQQYQRYSGWTTRSVLQDDVAVFLTQFDMYGKTTISYDQENPTDMYFTGISLEVTYEGSRSASIMGTYENGNSEDGSVGRYVAKDLIGQEENVIKVLVQKIHEAQLKYTSPRRIFLDQLNWSRRMMRFVQRQQTKGEFKYGDVKEYDRTQNNVVRCMTHTFVAALGAATPVLYTGPSGGDEESKWVHVTLRDPFVETHTDHTAQMKDAALIMITNLIYLEITHTGLGRKETVTWRDYQIATMLIHDFDPEYVFTSVIPLDASKLIMMHLFSVNQADVSGEDSALVKGLQDEALKLWSIFLNPSDVQVTVHTRQGIMSNKEQLEELMKLREEIKELKRRRRSSNCVDADGKTTIDDKENLLVEWRKEWFAYMRDITDTGKQNHQKSEVLKRKWANLKDEDFNNVYEILNAIVIMNNVPSTEERWLKEYNVQKEQLETITKQKIQHDQTTMDYTVLLPKMWNGKFLPLMFEKYWKMLLPGVELKNSLPQDGKFRFPKNDNIGDAAFLIHDVIDKVEEEPIKGYIEGALNWYGTMAATNKQQRIKSMNDKEQKLKEGAEENRKKIEEQLKKTKEDQEIMAKYKKNYEEWLPLFRALFTETNKDINDDTFNETWWKEARKAFQDQNKNKTLKLLLIDIGHTKDWSNLTWTNDVRSMTPFLKSNKGILELLLYRFTNKPNIHDKNVNIKMLIMWLKEKLNEFRNVEHAFNEGAVPEWWKTSSFVSKFEGDANKLQIERDPEIPKDEEEEQQWIEDAKSDTKQTLLKLKDIQKQIENAKSEQTEAYKRVEAEIVKRLMQNEAVKKNAFVSWLTDTNEGKKKLAEEAKQAWEKTQNHQTSWDGIDDKTKNNLANIEFHNLQRKRHINLEDYTDYAESLNPILHKTAEKTIKLQEDNEWLSKPIIMSKIDNMARNQQKTTEEAKQHLLENRNDTDKLYLESIEHVKNNNVSIYNLEDLALQVDYAKQKLEKLQETLLATQMEHEEKQERLTRLEILSQKRKNAEQSNVEVKRKDDIQDSFDYLVQTKPEIKLFEQGVGDKNTNSIMYSILLRKFQAETKKVLDAYKGKEGKPQDEKELVRAVDDAIQEKEKKENTKKEEQASTAPAPAPPPLAPAPAPPPLAPAPAPPPLAPAPAPPPLVSAPAPPPPPPPSGIKQTKKNNFDLAPNTGNNFDSGRLSLPLSRMMVAVESHLGPKCCDHADRLRRIFYCVPERDAERVAARLDPIVANFAAMRKQKLRINTYNRCGEATGTLSNDEPQWLTDAADQLENELINNEYRKLAQEFASRLLNEGVQNDEEHEFASRELVEEILYKTMDELVVDLTEERIVDLPLLDEKESDARDENDDEQSTLTKRLRHFFKSKIANIKQKGWYSDLGHAFEEQKVKSLVGLVAWLSYRRALY
jgi:hypothetical protein